MDLTARPLLIAGVPRSGSSWIGRVLGTAPGVAYVHEPDNEKRDPFALRAKQSVGRFPVLSPEDEAPEYERLWRGAFAGGAVSLDARHQSALAQFAEASPAELEDAVAGRGLSARLRSAATTAEPRGPVTAARVVVKSVHAALALEWIRARFDVDVVVVLRHPLNVLASMLDLDMPDRDRALDRVPRVATRYADGWGVPLPSPDAPALERAAWQVGLLQAALTEAPGVTVTVSHDEVCLGPVAAFRSTFEKLALPWTDAVEQHLVESDRPGSGYKTQRVAALQPQRWKRRFGEDEVGVVRRVLKAFPLRGWPVDGSAP